MTDPREKFAYPFDDLPEMIKAVQFGRASIPMFAEIHMTLPPERIGDNQDRRFECHCQDSDGNDFTMGWSDTHGAMKDGVEKHPDWCYYYQIDRTKDSRLRVPLPPYALHPNARQGWQSKASAVKKQRTWVGDLAFGFVHERYAGYKPMHRRVAIQLTFVLAKPKGGGRKYHDPDNLIAWAKSTIDGLTDAGVLADDREIIHLPPKQKFGTSEGSLEIGIWPISQEVCPLCSKSTS